MHLLPVYIANIVPNKFLFFPSKPKSLEIAASFFVLHGYFARDYAFLRVHSAVYILDCLYDFLTICVDFLQIKC